MTMYEDGALKDQKLNKKQLISAPEFKQHLLQPLHHLQAEFQASVLDKVINTEVSLKEMKDKAASFRALEAVKRAFVRCTNSQTWVDAVERFPTFTTEVRLAQFSRLGFSTQHSRRVQVILPECYKHTKSSARHYEAGRRGQSGTR